MKLKLIIALVSDDKIDVVVDAARSAGATGDTIISGVRGEGLRPEKTFLGLDLTSRRDMVLFLVAEQRARDILATLENDELSGGRRPVPGGDNGGGDAQLDLFRREPAAHARILEQIRATNVDELTPLQALALLADLQRDLETPD